MTELNTLAGIDFGAKLAGTTAITSIQHSKFIIQQCKKGKDADAWLLEEIRKLKTMTVFIDAPLSLPAAYMDTRSNEFFYRDADKRLNAMSPMFLGGLTARAMKLKRTLNAQNISVIETYPAALVRELLPNTRFYKNELDKFRKELHNKLKVHGLPRVPRFSTFHEADSMLAWISGYRHLTHQSRQYGTTEEGLIFI
jgi:predicted nuclease with RNAse H fold